MNWLGAILVTPGVLSIAVVLFMAATDRTGRRRPAAAPERPRIIPTRYRWP